MIQRTVQSFREFVCPKPALRNVLIAILYVAVFFGAIWFAYQLRFDFDVPPGYAESMLAVCAIAVAVKLVCMLFFGQFDGLLSFFSTPDLKRILAACGVSLLVLVAIRLQFGVQFGPPRGVILADFVLSVAAITTVRLSFRTMRKIAYTGSVRAGLVRCRVGIVGAGDVGSTLARELLTKPWLAMQPVAFFDDHLSTRCRMHGIPVVGKPEEIAALREKLKLQEIIIAMPSAPTKRIRRVVELSQAAGLPCRTVPSLNQLAHGRVSVTNLRPVDIQDLLGRASVKIELDEVRRSLAGQTVMVTGAGGSIGSELCRQILSFQPAALLLVERSEPHLFAIEQELIAGPNGSSIVPLIGDVTCAQRMRGIFQQFRPHVVFHAAAHKHVPLMESHPAEAIRNNILGTALTVDLAIEHCVERFMFISTDKAVNPTSAMGASKRCAELYVQASAAAASAAVTTKFMAVRFGNVLGSSGSVVPTFHRQIAKGGPVTVTHPDITRFFMTIPEAVTLVLQSSAFGNGGDIFMLDMGEPVKITELARQIINLSGFRPGEDIDIVFTGLRPGEKLHEELSHDWENATATAHPKIKRLIGHARPLEPLRQAMRELTEAADRTDIPPQELKRLLIRSIVQSDTEPSSPASAVGQM